MKKSTKAKKLPAPLPVAPPKPPPKDKRAEYVDTLPDHLSAFGRAIWRDRDTCRKLLDDAMEEYDDKVYDAAIDAATNKIGPDVLAAMTSGREAILTHADSILAIACDCAGDHVSAPSTRRGSSKRKPPRAAGETIGCSVSAMHSNEQEWFLQSFVDSLTPAARDALWSSLDRLP